MHSRADRLVHPVTRSAFFASRKFDSADRKLASHQFIEVRSADQGVSPEGRTVHCRQFEFLFKLPDHFLGEKSDLPLDFLESAFLTFSNSATPKTSPAIPPHSTTKKTRSSHFQPSYGLSENSDKITTLEDQSYTLA